jgi:hypothetical protein
MIKLFPVLVFLGVFTACCAHKPLPSVPKKESPAPERPDMAVRTSSLFGEPPAHIGHEIYLQGCSEDFREGVKVCIYVSKVGECIMLATLAGASEWKGFPCESNKDLEL